MTLSKTEITTAVVIAAIIGVAGFFGGRLGATLEAGEASLVGSSPAVVQLKNKVADLEDEVSDLKQAHAAAAAEASAERAALAQQSNQILSALLNN